MGVYVSICGCLSEIADFCVKTVFIINPCSGRNRRRPWLAGAIRDFARTHLSDAMVFVTEGPGHATEMARASVAAGAEIIVAVGGDGTMNEVAQALIHAPAALALVPCGSGNGLALHLGLPRSLRNALDLVASASPRFASIDTGIVGDRPFFNAMGLGFDAEVSRRFNNLTRRGLPAYVRATLAVLRSAKSERCVIITADRQIAVDALLVAIANSDQYGNNARIAPGARIDDGLLDLVAINDTGLLGLAALVPSLFLGHIDQSRHVTRISGTAFTIVRAAPGIIHTDGETHAAGARVEVRVNPRSLRILVPASSRFATSASAAAGASFALQIP
jgi:YegS/Rv2252/BmrU family lipid kinase